MGVLIYENPQGFPWDSITEDSMVVDVGGGLGAPAMVLARNHPHLHLIVQDREIVVVQAIEVSCLRINLKSHCQLLIIAMEKVFS